MLSSIEDYWPTSIISHNKLPLFHFFPTSYFSTTSELFYTFYKKPIVIPQKYNVDNLSYNYSTNQIQYF
jgi:hypothetical protein